jgi:hypothetical protein
MKRRKYVVFAMAVLVALTAVAFWRFAPPAYGGAAASTTATEEALATPDTLVLASVDFDYLDRIRDRYFGKASASDLPAAPEEPNSTVDALHKVVERAGKVSHLSFALYRTETNALGTILVLDGTFAPERLAAALGEFTRSTPSATAANTWSVQYEDPDSCKLSESWTIQATRERIVAIAGGDESMLSRLRDNARSSRDLSRWREFRAKRFAAAVVFLPDKLPENRIDPLLAMGAQVAKDSLKDFRSIYLGASMHSLLPNGELALWLVASNPQVAANLAQSGRQKLEASRKQWARTMPTIAAMHSHAKVDVHNDVIEASVRLDREFAQKLSELPAELLGQMFGGSGLIGATNQATADEEQIDKNPRVFVTNTRFDQLAAFDNHDPFGGKPQAIVGPFGIELRAVRLVGSEPRALELELRARSSRLPNLADKPTSQMSLFVTSVRDAHGQELLRAERCGRERNSAPASLQFATSEHPEVTKTVRLIANARQTDIASIKGFVRLRLPTKVETVPLSPPNVGDRFDKYGMRVEVTQIGQSSIGYRLSGETERLLHVRALNPQGQPLVRGATMTSGDATGKSIHADFKGHVGSVDLIVASEIEQHDVAFELKDAHIAPADDWAMRPVETFSSYSNVELARDLAKPIKTTRFGPPVATSSAGPLILDLDRVGTFGSLRLDFSLFPPNLKNLRGSVSAAELQIDEVRFADGSAQGSDGAWSSLIPFEDAGDNFRGEASIDTGMELRERQLSSISGSVLLRVPRSVEIAAIPTSEVGQTVQTACGSITLLEVSSRNVSIGGNGERSCIYSVHAIGMNGKEVFMGHVSTEGTHDLWTAKLPISSVPAQIQFIAAKEVRTMKFPFTISAARSDQ